MAMPWDDVISDTDREIFDVAGWGRRAGYGDRPALLVIDVNYNFCGDRAVSALESIQETGATHADLTPGTASR